MLQAWAEVGLLQWLLAALARQTKLTCDNCPTGCVADGLERQFASSLNCQLVVDCHGPDSQSCNNCNFSVDASYTAYRHAFARARPGRGAVCAAKLNMQVLDKALLKVCDRSFSYKINRL